MVNKTSKNKDDEDDTQVGSKSNTIVVGMKLDQESKEVLTWALVKVAQPGDSVIALHVLDNSEGLKEDVNSPLLALLKAFDSVLSVYEGFCNLKQVDLKLKICRGSSVRKVLVQEAKSYDANKVIVGISSRNRHSIRSTTMIAKYLSKKLPRECSVTAVHNGKVFFQREKATSTKNGLNDGRSISLQLAIHRSSSKNPKLLSDDENKKNSRTLGQQLLKARDDCGESECKRNGAICAQHVNAIDDSLALVPLHSEEAAFLFASELNQLKPGWPLLRQATMPTSKTKSEKDPVRKISVVQWAMLLPDRHSSLVVFDSGPKENTRDQENRYRLPSLDGESGAIVPVGISFYSRRSSFDETPKSLPIELEGLHEKYSSTCRLFRYQELVAATSNFMPENLIGMGGSSQVYKGCLSDANELAVKILNPSEDAVKEFVLEIEIITTLHHENIISLFGFCYEDNNLLLVHDYLPRGSLEENLHGEKNDKVSFYWPERYKVALGTAKALHYLHTHTTKPVIHRDVKSSNILLSEDFEPQLSDFGLAMWASTSSSHITCMDVKGTFGYLAPEYFMYGKVNEKIDVYAFGVVLLEILSGRKPISNEYPEGQQSLVMWATPILAGGKVVQLLDPTLGDSYDCDQMQRMALAASLCIRREPRARPQMSLVLKLLEGDVDVTKWARQQVLASEEFDGLDGESLPPPDMLSHLNLALHDVEDDSLSLSSVEQGLSLENYLQGRCSRSSSFD
ncbi:hypothetical protein ACHQM5_016529 [Ranunculus cassubicifolius]